MIGDCHYPVPADCNEETVITIEVPDPQRNSGWTNWNPDVDDLKIVDFSDKFGSDPAANEIIADTTGDGLVDVVSYWMPTEWCADHDPMGGKSVCGGGGGGGPKVEVGEQYQMLDKEAKQSSWMLGDGVVNHDTDTFRIVLMECTDDSTKRAATVTGFATIKIDKAHIQDPCPAAVVGAAKISRSESLRARHVSTGPPARHGGWQARKPPYADRDSFPSPPRARLRRRGA
jgi:hypothetical protein